ncbi:unnamed protein product [Pleuronectes platessa]|uniref:Uncharacterized protein n=1 Tax=Pleuronectes platessa TaxID=8262 RepID=A0A9N7VCF8_PLEPL|nr:unnamed protein product [Pleuronectes platessa]
MAEEARNVPRRGIRLKGGGGIRPTYHVEQWPVRSSLPEESHSFNPRPRDLQLIRVELELTMKQLMKEAFMTVDSGRNRIPTPLSSAHHHPLTPTGSRILGTVSTSPLFQKLLNTFTRVEEKCHGKFKVLF